MIAFVKDPTDKFKGDSGMKRLTSTENSQKAKWWQSTTFVVDGLPDLYYTSYDDKEPRLSSPGQLVLYCMGASNMAGNLTIDFEWEVCLYYPGLEDPKDKPAMNGLSLWMKDKGTHLWVDVKEGNGKDLKADIRLALPDAQEGDIYKLPYAASYMRFEGDIASIDTIWVRSFFAFLIKAATDGSGDLIAHPYVMESNETFGDKSKGDVEVIPKGTIFEVIRKEEDDESFYRGSEFICYKSSLTSCLNALERATLSCKN